MNEPISVDASNGVTFLLVAGSMSLADAKPEFDVGVHETSKALDALNSHHRQQRHSAAGTLVFPRVT